ncbi:hypothetical protein BJY04DRAFT_183140 [Aspergillus karnatakaensis]|uniref:uncharacterized protein n=1 Tax=Aspergillus karnatakaensis TaxID=1810916 RepID=UPI003CCCE0E3
MSRGHRIAFRTLPPNQCGQPGRSVSGKPSTRQPSSLFHHHHGQLIKQPNQSQC